jgi:hypothetical protein
LGRDITATLESGAINDLRDIAKQVHSIIVTQTGAVPIDPGQGDAEYDLWFDVTQYTQYRSGTDASNSDDEASIERETIIDAFKNPNSQTGVLQGAQPISFPRGSIGPFKPGAGTQIRKATAQLRVRNAYGCS